LIEFYSIKLQPFLKSVITEFLKYYLGDNPIVMDYIQMDNTEVYEKKINSKLAVEGIAAQGKWLISTPSSG